MARGRYGVLVRPSSREGALNSPVPVRDPHVVVLHIGAMKTGTTYLQGKAYANRDALAEAGVELAGRTWGEQVWGVQELLGMGEHDEDLRTRNAGAWDRIATGMRESDAPVSLFSMEFLAFADRAQARRVVESLAGCEIRLVLTVRDTAAVIPALWQTTITSGGTTTWPRFRSAVRVAAWGRGRVGAGLSRFGVASASRFTEAVDIGRILRVWTSVLPAEQIHVIVVPRPGAPRDLLWRHLCAVVDVDADVAPEEAEESNESLGFPSAELVRRVNAALDLAQVRDQNVVKNDLGLNTLGKRRREERRALLDPATHRTALRWNQRIRDEVTRHGVVVHGDLADLPVDPVDAAAAGHEIEEEHLEPTEEELLAAARHGLSGLRVIVRRRTSRLFGKKRARRFRRRLRRRTLGVRRWGSAPDPTAAAVADLVVSVQALVRLRRRRERIKRRRG